MCSTEPHTDLTTCKIPCLIGRVTRQIYEIGRPIGRSGVRRCNWSKHPNTHANVCQFHRHQRGAAAGGRGPPLMSIPLAYVGMCIRMLRPIASSDAWPPNRVAYFINLTRDPPNRAAYFTSLKICVGFRQKQFRCLTLCIMQCILQCVMQCIVQCTESTKIINSSGGAPKYVLA